MDTMADIMIDQSVAGAVSDEGEEPLPERSRIQKAVELACRQVSFPHKPQLCIRFSDDAAVQALNHQWRDKDAVTDVLSFPMHDSGDFPADESLGDIIIAVPFTRAEAAKLELPVPDHMLHLIVHATLHLLGYDHVDDGDAKIMHQHERAVMRALDLHDPYPDEEGGEESDEEGDGEED